MDLLAEIRAAWPVTPYPGDHILSDCWCEECEFSVRNLRGKSWKQLKLEDFDGQSDQMGIEAYEYYLPGILVLSVQNPDEFSSSDIIYRLFTFSDNQHEAPERQQQVSRVSGSLTQRQRRVLLAYLNWLADQGWEAPILLSAARRAICDGVVEPYSFDEFTRWCRQRERELKSQA